MNKYYFSTAIFPRQPDNHIAQQLISSTLFEVLHLGDSRFEITTTYENEKTLMMYCGDFKIIQLSVALCFVGHDSDVQIK